MCILLFSLMLGVNRAVWLNTLTSSWCVFRPDVDNHFFGRSRCGILFYAETCTNYFLVALIHTKVTQSANIETYWLTCIELRILPVSLFYVFCFSFCKIPLAVLNVGV